MDSDAYPGGDALNRPSTLDWSGLVGTAKGEPTADPGFHHFSVRVEPELSTEQPALPARLEIVDLGDLEVG